MSAAPAAAESSAAPQGNTTFPKPLDPNQQPPLDRYCDLVLTGGVTDGIVYPWAVLEIARHYRLKNIGGTSVGAMAAALAAAAEYARRRGHLTGYNEVLRKLPERLAETVYGQTRLLSLFQPARADGAKRSTRRLFDFFVGVFSPEHDPQRGKQDKRWRYVLPMLKAYRFWSRYVLPILKAYLQAVLIGVAVALAVGIACALAWNCWVGPEAGLTWIELGVLAIGLAIPVAVVLVLALVLLGIYCDLVHGVLQNDYGLCRGGHVKGFPEDQPALTEWLYYGIQGAARKPLAEPLTFKDLWEAPNGPDIKPMPPSLPRRKPRSIDLRMVTTNLTHGRPYGLPLDDDTSRLFFKLEELEPFFPPEIIEHLKNHAKTYAEVRRPDDPPESVETADILELPRGELPIVVASRLSLSFPFLFSTVPLWAIDHVQKKVCKCLFSDGGLCSNFPIHMFDAAIPAWPTFGILLSSRSVFQDERRFWLPELHDKGYQDSWHRFPDEASPLSRMYGFAKAIIFTAKDWNDQSTARMPGVRDRVVRIFLNENEAGLNLKLTPEQIMLLARAYGWPAGQELIAKFITGDPPSAVPTRGWNEHRWVRFNTFLVVLRERLAALTRAAELFPYSRPMSRHITEAGKNPPLKEAPPGTALSSAQARDLENLLAALKALETALAQAVMTQPYEPKPEPTLRVRAPL